MFVWTDRAIRLLDCGFFVAFVFEVSSLAVWLFVLFAFVCGLVSLFVRVLVCCVWL